MIHLLNGDRSAGPSHCRIRTPIRIRDFHLSIKVRNANAFQADSVRAVLEIFNYIKSVAGVEHEHVISTPAAQHIVIIAAVQRIVSGAAPQRVFARAPIQDIVFLESSQKIVSGSAVQRIVSGSA